MKKMKKNVLSNRWVLALGALAALAALPKIGGSPTLVEWVIQFCCYGLFAMSLNLMVGTSGMLSFGHGMYFGIGAYAFCLLLKLGGMGIPAAFCVTLLISGATAFIVSTVVVRLEGVFYSFITLAVQMLLYSVILAWSELTGGEQGLIGGVPRPPFAGVNLGDPWHFYLFAVTIFVACVTAMHVITRSPFGTAMRMIRDNPRRANLTGVNTYWYRVTMSVFASLFASVGGMLLGLHISGAYPNFAYWTMSGEGLFMIMLGGIGQFFGPLVGAALLIVLNGLINIAGLPHGMVVGGVILLLVLVLKKGLLEAVLAPWQRRQAASEEVLRPAETGVAK